LRNRPLLILFKNTVAADKGNTINNTVQGRTLLCTELKSPLFCQHFDKT